MTAPREFDLGAILTVTTGRYLLDDVGDLYDILNFMTGDNLFTHQLVRAGDECRRPLLFQHPELAAVEVPTFYGETSAVRDGYSQWLDEQRAIYGASLAVWPLEGGHVVIDPLTEFQQVLRRPE